MGRTARCLLPLAAVALGKEAAYHWPQHGGNPGLTGAPPGVLGPTDLSDGPAWSWPNEGDELKRHSPLVDEKGNIFLATARGVVRKFSPDGQILWSWNTAPSQGKIVASPALYKGAIYFATTGSLLLALDLATGAVRLEQRLPEGFGNPMPDSHSLVIQDDVAFLPSRVTDAAPFNNKVVALQLPDCALLWETKLGEGAFLVNFHPALPGDGSMLFATPTARAYRLNASTGEILWQAPFPETGHGLQGTGGGALSPDGKRFFAVGTYRRGVPGGPATPLGTVPSCVGLNLDGHGCLFGDGVAIAYDVASGEVVWARRLRPGTSGKQAPAVANIAGPGSRLAVFVGMGDNTWDPEIYAGPAYLPLVVRYAIARLQLQSWRLRRFMEVRELRSGVEAMDAETGAELWRWEQEPAWERRAAEGDDGPLPARVARFYADPILEDFSCLPPAWGTPTVGADGTVYAASGHSGRLFALRDADGDGRVRGDGEVSVFSAQSGFHGGAVLAPGMLVASPCWGPMHVFKF